MERADSVASDVVWTVHIGQYFRSYMDYSVDSGLTFLKANIWIAKCSQGQHVRKYGHVINLEIILDSPNNFDGNEQLWCFVETIKSMEWPRLHPSARHPKIPTITKLVSLLSACAVAYVPCLQSQIIAQLGSSAHHQPAVWLWPGGRTHDADACAAVPGVRKTCCNIDIVLYWLTWKCCRKKADRSEMSSVCFHLLDVRCIQVVDMVQAVSSFPFLSQR